MYLSIGTGVGMGIVVGGELHRGARGAAGEVGFLPLAARPGHGGRAARRAARWRRRRGAGGIVRTGARRWA